MRFASLGLARLTDVALFMLIGLMGNNAHAGLTIDQAIDTDGLLSATISPNGKYVAAIGYAGITNGLVLIDVDSMTVKTIVQTKVDSFQERGPGGVMLRYNRPKEPLRATWLSDDLIAVDYGFVAETVTLAGKTVAELGTGIYRKTDTVVAGAPLVVAFTDDSHSELGLVNARTGSVTKIRVPMSGSAGNWVFDQHGGLRALTISDSTTSKAATSISNWYRDSVTAEWTKLAEFKITENRWLPQAVTSKVHTLVISSSMGRDTRAIFNYDTEKREVGEMLVGHPTEDVMNTVGDIEKSLDGVATNGMIPHKYWFDPVWRDLQASVDTVLPKRINVLTGNPEKRVLVRSSGDTDPGTWLVLDAKEMTLTSLGRVQSSIDPAQMLPMQTFSYPARDGLAIPAYLTRPKERNGAAPLVVMIHGGPAVRDTWAWDADVQLLAARGYMVFQPQFRGSSGFGNKFERAGFQQWGLSMQDDISAGVEYLIKLGVADPKRICIYGASYGGYAALWGMAKTPDLYQCGISFAGVSDIAFMFKDDSDRNANKDTRTLMRLFIGDPERDRERFDQVSPLKQAAHIKAPLLIMHGEADQRVPIEHAEKMRAALAKLNKPFEYEYFADEGHGVFYESNSRKYYKHLFAFLDKYIGTGVPAKVEAEPFVLKPTAEKRHAERRRVYVQLTEF